MPRIAVDAMGGDGGPETVVPAIKPIANEFDITLIGDQARIEPLLDHPRVKIVHADEAITPDHSLSEIVRGLPESSLRIALRMHADNETDAVVSAGDTAALMALARLELGMIPGASRPAIIKGLTGIEREFWLLDIGANLECSAELLVQFARMGSVMAATVGGVTRPGIGLLNIGTEADKGPDTLQLAAQLLAAEDEVNYRGFVEGQRLFHNDVDVIVCDGFAGNIALKSVEGAATMAAHLLQEARSSRGLLKRSIGRLLGLSADMSRLFDPQQYNGASLIGVRGVVVKSHGGANQAGIVGAVREAGREVQAGVLGDLESTFA